jgi:hypothetical protein
MKVESDVRAFVEGSLLRGARLVPGRSLWDQGVDSLGLLRLVRFLETRFGLKVPHADVTPARFGTIEAIAAYVASRLKGR